MKIVVFCFLAILNSCNVRTPSDQKQSSTSKYSNVTSTEYYPANTSPFENNIQTLDLMFVHWSCACANWITEQEYERYKDTGKLSDQTFFVEPDKPMLQLPDTIGYSGDLIRVTGQFYTEKGYPKGLRKNEMDNKKARVFRYTSFKILRSNHKEYIKNE